MNLLKRRTRNFKQNKIEKRRLLQELNQDLAKQSAYGTENEHKKSKSRKKIV